MRKIEDILKNYQLSIINQIHLEKCLAIVQNIKLILSCDFYSQ